MQLAWQVGTVVGLIVVVKNEKFKYRFSFRIIVDCWFCWLLVVEVVGVLGPTFASNAVWPHF
jgi:hypothetical protein